MLPAIETSRSMRCAACQLQLCKSRSEPPHAALREVTRDKQAISYLCQTCGVTLTCDSDLAKPGWVSQRK